MATTTTTSTEIPVAPTSSTMTIESRLSECVSLIKKAISNHDDSYVLRALRKTTLIRKNPLFTPSDFQKCLKKYFPRNSLVSDAIFSLFVSEMEVESAPTTETTTSSDVTLSPEVELYLHNTAINYAKGRNLSNLQTLLNSSKVMMDRIGTNTTPSSSSIETVTTRRMTMDVLRSRALQTYALLMEQTQTEGLYEYLLNAHRLACLSGDYACQAVAYNLILRKLTLGNQIAQAEMFANKARYPLEATSNNSQIRHLYYMGRIQALELDYSQSLSSLLHAIRKLPNSSLFKGLRLKLYKLATVVTLLTGELPDRSWFSDKEYKEALLPYFDLVKSVRLGNIQTFQTLQQAHSLRFEKDHLASLIQRLHSSVIKTGLKSIGVSYSNISFHDVALKLQLAQSEEALYLCAKAIRDGVLDSSSIDSNDCLCSSEPQDLYSTTTEPSDAYQRRITYLMQAHNEAVKALRFPAQKSANQNPAGTNFEFDEDADLDDLADSHGLDEE